MLSLKQLRYAIAVWHERSFSRAARRINASQPAISGQVRMLEEELGFRLFRRTGQGIEVTEMGRTFLLQAEQAYAAVMRLPEAARQLRGGVAGSFAVGVSSGIVEHILPLIMRAVTAAKPQLRLEVVTTATRRINRLLSEERLDVGVTVESDPRGVPPDLVHERFASVEMVLMAHPGHRLANAPAPIDLPDLGEEPLIMNELSVGYGEVVLSMFADRGLRPNIVAVSDDVETIKTMVKNGGGVAIVPRISADNEVALGQLRMLPIRPARKVQIMLVRRAEALAPAVESCIDLIRAGLAGSAVG